MGLIGRLFGRYERPSCREALPFVEPSWRPAVAGVDMAELGYGRRVVVHFWAPWALSLAKQVDTTLVSLARDFEMIAFRSCNVEEEAGSKLAHECQIVTIPTIVLLSGGEAAGRIIGAGPAERYRRIFHAWNQAYRAGLAPDRPS